MPRKYKQMTAEERREAKRQYQREYYLKHIEKAKAYQRQYNLTHKKKRRPRTDCKGGLPRPQRRIALTGSMLMQDSVDHFVKDIEGILKGEKYLVPSRRRL